MKKSYTLNAHIPTAKENMRKCHDCGKLTTNYRCTACRTKFEVKHKVYGEDRYNGKY